MIKIKKNIGKQGTGKRQSAGIAYIHIPLDTDRDKYIFNCLRTHTVSLITEDGQYIPKVNIGKMLIQFIDFPEDTGKVGSPVVWVNIPFYNEPVVIDVLSPSDEMQGGLEEKQFKFRRSNGNAVVEISGRGKKGQLFINVDGDDDDSGRVYINIRNKSKTGKLNLKIQGDIEADVEGKVELLVSDEFKVEVSDPNDDENISIITATKEQILIESNAIKHNAGESPMVLGDKQQELEDKRTSEYDNHTHPTALGPSGTPLIPIAAILKDSIAAITSDKSSLE